MIHDIAPSRLDVAWKSVQPRPGDLLVAEREGALLLDQGRLPTVTGRETGPLTYLLELDGRRLFWLEEGTFDGADACDAREWGSLRTEAELSKAERFLLLTAMHLIRWYRSTRFCGTCGSAMAHGDRERVQVCPRCGRLEYPRINPVVMLAVHDGKRLLLGRGKGRPKNGPHGLIAGFMEIGESPEDAARREVYEETGIRIKNLRYYRSQPWALSQSLLLGFFAELDGDDAITVQESELDAAEWIPREEIWETDDDFSLTRHMIQAFRDGTYPGCR